MATTPVSDWHNEVCEQVLSIEVSMRPGGSVVFGADAFGQFSGQLLEPGVSDRVRRLRAGYRLQANGVLGWILPGISTVRIRGSVLMQPLNRYVGHVDAVELLMALELLDATRSWLDV